MYESNKPKNEKKYRLTPNKQGRKGSKKSQ